MKERGLATPRAEHLCLADRPASLHAKIRGVSLHPFSARGGLRLQEGHHPGVAHQFVAGRPGASLRAPPPKIVYSTGKTSSVSGLAINEDGGKTFTRASKGPILDRNDADPYLTSSPCVLHEGGRWRMWYVSGTGWTGDRKNRRHQNHIKYAESTDGIQWKRAGQVAIDYASPAEYAISRPTVLLDQGTYKMWFACRGNAYRFGYAESRDGSRWDRNNSKSGLAPSGEGWDKEMQAYPFVFENRGRLHVLYNGNGHGQTGIGWAATKEERRARAAPDPEPSDFNWQG